MISPFQTEWKLKYQGAESKIWTGRILDKNVIKKERFKKTYRNIQLDERLSKERTKAELRNHSNSNHFLLIFKIQSNSRSLIKLKGLNLKFSNLIPTIYFSTTREIIMSEIEDAKTINEFTKLNKFSDCNWFYLELGKIISDLHKANIVHGDLTTTNFLIDSNKNIIPIDFGLSQTNGTVEEYAVDLYVLERSLLTNDYEHFKGFEIILNQYKKEMGKKGLEILKKLDEVRLRGRKRNMAG